jgi:hypothetical protein
MRFSANDCFVSTDTIKLGVVDRDKPVRDGDFVGGTRQLLERGQPTSLAGLIQWAGWLRLSRFLFGPRFLVWR